MKMSARFISGLLLVFATTVGCQHDSPSPNLNDRPTLAAALGAARTHLSLTYDGSQSKSPKITYDPKSPLTPLETLDLNRVVPRTRFFLTELEPGHYEYSIVRAIVSVTAQGDRMVTHSALSPTFVDGSAERFLSQFAGLSTQSNIERERLALSIAGLVREITGRGSLRIGACKRDRLVIELHNAHIHWRDIQFHFAPAGNLDRIRMVNPRGD